MSDCHRTKSLEFTAWSSSGSSCWPRTV